MSSHAAAVPAAAGALPHRAEGRHFLAVALLFSIVAGGLSGGIVARVWAVAPVATPAASPTAAAPTAPLGVTALDVAAIVASVRPAVVAIDVVTTVTLGPRTVTEQGSGTGFIIADDGMIATNAHVVSGARQITVTLSDGSTAAGTVVGADTDADLAVIHVSRTGLPSLAFGRSSALRVGDPVVVVGNALALAGGPTASLGIVSALDRTITTTGGKTYARLLQTDAAMNPGDSGGPLVDAAGRVVGINTIGTVSAENVGFAIRSDDAAAVLEKLIAR